MTGRKIEIQEMPNPDYVCVHFNFELECDSGGPHFLRPLREHGEYWYRLPDETKKVVRAVMEVDGIFHVTVHAYELVLEKGRLFDFEPAASALRSALQTLFGDDVDITTSSHPAMNRK